MRNPNGFGTIKKLSGNRRRPYMLLVTVSSTKGRQERKAIGYYATIKEAKRAQIDYAQGLIGIDSNEATFASVYERFKTVKFPRVGKSQQSIYSASFDDFAALHHRKFSEIRKADMQAIIDDCTSSTSKKEKLRTLCKQLFDFAIDEDVVIKNYANGLVVEETVVTNPHRVLTPSEIGTLFKNTGDTYVDYLIILLMTGMRMYELATVKVSDVDLEAGYMIGGSKTKAGKNRVIPLHESIRSIIKRNMGKETLFEEEGKTLPQHTVRTRLDKVREELGLDFQTHDTRKTFISIMYEQKVSKLTVQRIVGHRGHDVTENAYTDISLKLMLTALDEYVSHPVFVPYLFPTQTNANKRAVIS